MRPAWRLGRHAAGGIRHGMLRTGTDSAVPQELLHHGKVARGPQSFTTDRSCEGFERGLGTPTIARVTRDPGEAKQHAPRPTISAREPVVEHRPRALGDRRGRWVRDRGAEKTGRA